MRPSSSGYSQHCCHRRDEKAATIQFLPLIDLNLSDESCIYTTLLYVHKHASELGIITHIRHAIVAEGCRHHCCNWVEQTWSIPHSHELLGFHWSHDGWFWTCKTTAWTRLLTLWLEKVCQRQSEHTSWLTQRWRLGCKACVPHASVCGKAVSAWGLHGLACRRSGPRHQRHSQLNDILWWAFKRAQVPLGCTGEKMSGLSRYDGKHPDSVTLLPWAKGKPLAWDVTVPDTYADSHLADTVTTAGAAASNKANAGSG